MSRPSPRLRLMSALGRKLGESVALIWLSRVAQNDWRHARLVLPRIRCRHEGVGL